MRVLIIGGGIAGTTVAEDLRRLAPEAQITIVEAEEHRLYSRVLLPHYTEGRVERERVFLKKAEWYGEKSIELITGVTVEKIDVNNKFILTSEGRELPFDKLLITTGGNLRLVGDDMRGVAYLRSLDDADHLLQLIAEVKALPESERRAVIFGGGFIALEFLNIFSKHGIPSTLIMRGPGFWHRQISAHSQDVMRRHVEANGVEVVTNAPGINLLGGTELKAVRIEGREDIPARVIGVGIGIEADRRLFADAGIPCDIGVIANAFLETEIENVYTAGDVAEFYDVVADRQLNQGNWLSALMQGRAVAKTIAGERTSFELVSSYATDFLGKDVVFIGDTSRDHADAVRQLVAEADVSIELFDRGGRTVGAAIIGDVSKRQEITNAIKAREYYAG